MTLLVASVECYAAEVILGRRTTFGRTPRCSGHNGETLGTVSGMADEDALSEWTEVNITPASWEQRERLLLDVVDPLVHDTLDGRMAAWHYFWEPALRLRIRWKQPTQDDLRELTSFLDAAKTVGKLTAWISGNHGKPGETYTGEAPGYGPEVWDETYRDWTSASELALNQVELVEHVVTRVRWSGVVLRLVRWSSPSCGTVQSGDGLLRSRTGWGCRRRACTAAGFGCPVL